MTLNKDMELRFQKVLKMLNMPKENKPSKSVNKSVNLL
jgi:hypothetical protein